MEEKNFMNMKFRLVRSSPYMDTTHAKRKKLKEELESVLKECIEGDLLNVFWRKYAIFNVWSTLFKIGVKKVTFTNDEKLRIGKLLACCLLHLQSDLCSAIVQIREEFDEFIFPELMMIVSSIWFLKENYQYFPHCMRYKKIVDEIFENGMKLLSLLEDWMDSTNEESAPRIIVPVGVPKKHYWWFLREEKETLGLKISRWCGAQVKDYLVCENK